MKHLYYLLCVKVMYQEIIGNGARSPYLFVEDMIIFLTSSSVAGVKKQVKNLPANSPNVCVI